MIEKLSDLAFSDNEENVKLCDMLQKSLGVSVFKWFKIGYGNGNGNRYGNGFGFGDGVNGRIRRAPFRKAPSPPRRSRGGSPQ